MGKVRQWIDRMSVRKKLILYSYLTITPVLLVICLALIAHNYRQVRDERLENDRVSVHALAESWNMQQTNIKDFSTYICVNQEIHELLTCDNPEKKNENSRLWMDEAPMGIVQDMVALKGHIKTIAIYPENGVRPYLRGMDGSVNLATTDELRHAPIYQVAKNSENGMVWAHVEKGNEQIYEMNRTDKIVLYREIRDLAQKKTLGHITIDVSQEYFTSLSENALRSDEALLVTIDIDPEISHAKIPKLILQPFVENAIVHGFENLDVACSLSVSGTHEDGRIRFEIRDTGVGMRQDQIDALWEETQPVPETAHRKICD